MARAFAVLLVLLAVAAEVVFFLTGGGAPLEEPTALSQQLPPVLVGTPWLALAGGGVFVLGVLVGGKRKDGPYAIREVVLAMCTGAALALAAAVVVGVIRRWAYPTLGALVAGGCAETLVALVLCLRLLFVEQKHKLLLVPSLLVTLGLTAFFVAVIVLGRGS